MTAGRWMGLDVGSRRIGVALSDPLRITARPLEVFERTTLDADLLQVRKLIEEHQVVRLVVGVPRRLDGSESAATALVEAFVAQLIERAGVPVIRAEERLSSKEAEHLMAELDIPPSRRRERRDAFAAALILKWYLESQ